MQPGNAWTVARSNVWNIPNGLGSLFVHRILIVWVGVQECICSVWQGLGFMRFFRVSIQNSIGSFKSSFEGLKSRLRGQCYFEIYVFVGSRIWGSIALIEILQVVMLRLPMASQCFMWNCQRSIVYAMTLSFRRLLALCNKIGGLRYELCQNGSCRATRFHAALYKRALNHCTYAARHQ